MVAPKLLMLKEYLELDHDDDGGGLVLGGGVVVTVRSLLDAELREKTARSVRDAAAATTGNGNALGKFSAAIEAVKRRAAFSVLSWKRKKQRPPAAAEQNHRFPSPDTAAAEAKEEYSPSLSSSSRLSENEEEEEEATIATPSPATEFQGKVKEEEEEEGFYRSLDYFERATEQMHRIRRFEMLAEVDPAAECCSRSSDGECEEEEEEEERAWELLGRLKTNPPPRGGEKLLLDFFIQGGKGGGVLPLRQRPRQGATTTTKEMLRAARRWIDGRPGGEAAEQDSGHGEAATLREMERDGRWRCFHEEEEELGLQVGDEMIQSLVEDIVKELA